MAAGKLNLLAEQGAVFRRVVRYENPDETPVNLTGYTARMHVRKQPFNATPILELASGNGISIDGATGTITLTIPATTMANAPATEKAFYDLELIPPSGEADVIRLIEGKFTIASEVTRE